PMSANELLLLKSGDLLEQAYVTQEQETAIKDFQDAVNKRIAELAQGSETETEEPETEEDTDKDETEGNDNEGNTEEDNSDQDEDKDNESDVLSAEEAKKLVYEYLYGEGAGDSGSEDSNFKLTLDHQDGDKYIFHYYEAVNDGDGGHTATLGWYEVDSKTGKVTDLME